MKKRILNLIGVALCSVTLLTAPTGCALFNAATYSTTTQTADALIADAEKAAGIGLETMNTFVHLEKDHRKAYLAISPKIHEFAVWLKVRVEDPTDIQLPPGGDNPPIHLIPRGEAILKSVRKATKEFEANRTPAGEANLRTALATLQSVINDVNKYTALAVGGN